MRKTFTAGCGLLSLVAALSVPANADQINFTGGTVTQLGGATQTTNNSVVWQNVDYYVESGFKLDFIGNANVPFSAIIGNYYAVGNDVIHGHWATGDFGELTQIKVTKLDGAAFDLNYFVLTSNTDTGGAPASGNEKVSIHASLDGITSSFSMALPPENWGFPASQIFLDSNFDNIKAFWFTADNAVDCFGMDNFFINEAAPPSTATPEPGTFALVGLGLVGLVGRHFRRRNRSDGN